MPNQVIVEGWWGIFLILTELYTQSKYEQGLKVFSPINCPHLFLPPYPYLHAWELVLRPFDDGTHLWNKEDGKMEKL